MSAQTAQNAHLIYALGIQHGLTPARARELVAAAYEESHLNAGIDNRAGSGASGLFQLLSSGYRQRAKKLGGVYNPRANTLAILPDYVRYWRQHPHARPGEGAAAVEASGEGADFYAKDLGKFNGVGGAPQMGPGPRAAAPNGAPNALGLMQALGGGQTDVRSLLPLLQQAQAQPARPKQRRQPVQATSEHSVGATINELFYDPIGGIKYGKQVGAIGGHPDHVHVSLSSEGAQKVAIARARAMGLHVGEESNSDVHPVHVKGSFHYQHYRKGDPLRKAADVSGDPKRMAAYYRWIEAKFG